MAQPVRMCVGCRGRAAQPELIRVTASDGSVALDVRQRRPGRGAYLHPAAACVQQAVRRRAFGRALRAEVDAARTAALLHDHLATLA